MGVEFGIGLMDRLERRAGEFELTAGFKRNSCPARCIVKPDDIRPVGNRSPAELLLHSLQKSTNATLALCRHAFIGHRRMAALVKRNFLVLGADPELCRRLRACFEPSDKFIARRNGG